MAKTLQDRTALITGSTSGIGRAIASAFADEGATVAVTGRDAARGEAVVRDIRSRGGRAEFIEVDLTETGAAILLATKSLEMLGGRVDILVNNAAALEVGPTSGIDEARIGDVLTVNVGVPLLLARVLAPPMVQFGRGSILNIGSINGTKGMSDAALYSASKGALRMLTKAWAAEFGPSGVRVNELAVGPTATEGTNSLGADLARIARVLPARRHGQPDEIAAAAVFLSSDAAAFIHGAVLPVDGGWSAI